MHVISGNILMWANFIVECAIDFCAYIVHAVERTCQSDMDGFSCLCERNYMWKKFTKTCVQFNNGVFGSYHSSAASVSSYVFCFILHLLIILLILKWHRSLCNNWTVDLWFINWD